MPPILRALEHRNFRLYAFGHGVSLIGTWMQRVAMGWLAYRLSGSISLLGMIGFCSQGAVFFIAPFAGILGDHGNKRKLITIIQYIMLGQAVVLTLLAWFELIKPWHLLLLALTLGIASAFDAPLRQAMLTTLVSDKAHLPNAIALNSLLVNVARVAGPLIAGFVVSAFGEATCFAINTLSFAAIIFALWQIDWHDTHSADASINYWHSFMDGGRYVLQIEPIRTGFVLVCAVSWCIAPYMTLMPVFARDVLGGDATLLGNLLAASGIGTVAGTLYLASRRSTEGLGGVIAIAAGLSGLAMCVFALTATMLPALLALGLVGCGMTVAAAGTNTIFQSLAPAEMRGRIASFYIMAFIGVAPFGALASAAIADQTGIRPAFFLNGLACCMAALWFKSKSASKPKVL
ncbi:MFS transporter [Noviherbaspirillum sp.]|uniref:MFS transporter n=1 Tax=Noviherbaspirillum sp. TaxID=1926288 RepID=UPI002FE064E9